MRIGLYAAKAPPISGIYKTDCREAALRNPSFVNKKEYQSPQAATNKREDLSRVDTLHITRVSDALAGVKDRKGGLYVKNGELQYDAKVHPVKNMVSSEMTSTHTTEALHQKLHSPHYAGL